MPGESKQNFNKGLSTEEAWQLILDTRKRLTDSPSLEGRKTRLVTEAREALKDSRAGRDQRYQTFLQNVLGNADRQGVLVCAAALGKTRVLAMRAGDRRALLDKIKKNSSIFESPNISYLVSLHKVPNINGMSPDFDP